MSEQARERSTMSRATSLVDERVRARDFEGEIWVEDARTREAFVIGSTAGENGSRDAGILESNRC